MMGKALQYMLSNYPDHSADIIALYDKDEDFRILCEDYLTIAKEIEKCRLKVIKTKEYETEFVQVFLELKKEIHHLLDRMDK